VVVPEVVAGRKTGFYSDLEHVYRVPSLF